MANLTLDIILLARYLLVPGGRLVFFIPTITEEWDEVDLPVVEGMRELKCGSGSVQEFHSWGRRVSLPRFQRQELTSQLITMEKTAQDDGPPPTFPDHREVYEVLKGRVPGYHNFGQRVCSPV
jgi:tRNA (guanine10-N2)-methyltransferase